MPDHRGYPPYRGKRLSIAEALRRNGGHVAGRLRATHSAGCPEFADAGATVMLTSILPAAPRIGDWVSGRLEIDEEGIHLREVVVHATKRGPSPDPSLGEKLPRLQIRARIIQAARNWFAEQEFMEVETPTRVPCPGLEPHLCVFPSGNRYLITSPELHLKRLLAAGAERIVEFSRAFRDKEYGRWHQTEFALLEWYRAWSTLKTIEADCEALIQTLAAEVGVTELSGASLQGPFDRTTVRAQFQERCNIDLAEVQDRDQFASAAVEQGHVIPADDDWDAIFFRIWIRDIEPQLGSDRPVFVHGYPASQAALARIGSEDGFPVALRFELYAGGIELANAFDELNDPTEQRRRHQADRTQRLATMPGTEVPPLDENFLAALLSGMPPSAGIALGVDRLIALFCGVSDIEAVRAFRAYD